MPQFKPIKKPETLSYFKVKWYFSQWPPNYDSFFKDQTGVYIYFRFMAEFFVPNYLILYELKKFLATGEAFLQSRYLEYNT